MSRERLIRETSEGIVREAESVAKELRLNTEDILGAWLIDLHRHMRDCAIVQFTRKPPESHA
jgi:hypothetical protein